ncbi:hypothetical protein N7492_007665 [Penicillium capsulatum]|uniref:Uncharacterized protein n=1 Tax=Penicillium capsulatum TaxID=69766 RepID=A0A9W9LM20_9EURO|nr:hypothetical protein N7492_007665 [Penicillium capsulatum]KAJ6117499.1 hypothetical protein N7512_007224 [Penicillium capsulatum]
MATPSRQNAQNCRVFIPTLHSEPYPAIDPSTVTLGVPYVACIIGGRGAAGPGLARSYARAGATGLVLASRKLSSLDEVAAEIRTINPASKVVTTQCDISSNSDAERLAGTIQSEFNGHLDTVVVNAGFSGPIIPDVVQESPSDFQSALNVNTVGAFHAAHHLLPLLLETQSPAMSFIAICSMGAATVGGPLAHSHYCVSKAAQARLIEVISEQYADRGLFCASVHPGGMRGGLAKDVKALPKEIAHMMDDGPDLVGSFCVWLSTPNATRRRSALNGRFLSCKWDSEELEARFDDIQENDLLRFRIAVD